MIRLVIFKEAPERIPRKPIEKLFRRIMRQESDKSAQGKINLIFTSDKSIRRLNKEYRRKNKPTDVLSFNLEDPSGTSAVFGEVYISVPASIRQAREYGTSLNEEFLRLFCHGLLHLLGYDHIQTNERRKMEARERHYLKSLKAWS